MYIIAINEGTVAAPVSQELANWIVGDNNAANITIGDCLSARSAHLFRNREQAEDWLNKIRLHIPALHAQIIDVTWCAELPTVPAGPEEGLYIVAPKTGMYAISNTYNKCMGSLDFTPDIASVFASKRQAEIWVSDFHNTTDLNSAKIINVTPAVRCI